MSRLQNRLILDMTMTALLIFEMFFALTGDTLHEIVGIIFFVTILIHMALSYQWMSGMARAVGNGRMNGKGRTRIVMAILLFIVMVAMVVSSIAISCLLSGIGIDLAGSSYRIWATIHTASAYMLCVVVLIHLAMHWKSAVHAFRIPYDPQRRMAINTVMTTAVALGVVALCPSGFDAVSDSIDTGSASEDSGSSSSDSSATGSVPAQVSREKSNRPDGNPPSSDSGSSNSSSSSNGTASGNCTLCSKKCPLSAPKCNRPYEQGLISS